VWDDVAGGVVDLTARVRSMTAGTAAGVVPIGSLDEAGDLSRAVNRLAAHHAVEEARGEEARRRLDEADREKSEFLATVSHELRTPLNSIIGFSQLLLGGMDGDLSQAQREDVHIVESSGNHLLGIINDILDLSAMESRRIDLSRVIVHLDALAREVVRAAEGQLRGKSIVLRVDMRPPPDPVDADPKRLRQILGNLVANAIKFTQKGEIVVRARAVGRFVEVEVADTGPGIPSSELETIFESYAQLGDAKVRRRGTGLGLAICRHLVELHGGEIRAESQLGRGSSFFFTVPRAG
jgi:signal transduction histidine kinase